MKISTLIYCTKEGMRNIIRNIWFSLASVAIISACIFLFCMFFGLIANVQYMVRNAESTVGITVFFNEDMSEDDIQKIGDEIRSRDEVKEVKYVSAEEAWENFKKEYFKGVEDLAEGFADDNPLAGSASYEIYLKDIDMQDDMVAWLGTVQGIRKINYSSDTASGLSSFNKMLGLLSAVIIAILLAVAIFLISNTITTAAAFRREENRIMRLIGATNFMIRAPFVVQGVMIGLVGALIPLAITYFLYRQAVVYMMERFDILSNLIEFIPIQTIFPSMVAVAMALGVGIGFVGSFFTIRRHLKVLETLVAAAAAAEICGKKDENMKKQGLKIRAALFLVTAALASSPVLTSVAAATKKDVSSAKDKKSALEQEKKKTEEAIKSLQGLKSNTESYVKELDTKMNDLQSQVTKLENNISSKQKSIDETAVKLEEAQKTEKKQYASMKMRIKYMYEKGDSSYLNLLLEARSLSELLNRAEYVSKISEYDRKMLDQYVATKESIVDSKKKLETEKAELQEMKTQTEAKQDSVQLLLNEKNKELQNVNAQIGEKSAQAKAYEDDIKAQEAKIVQMEAEIKKKEAEEAAKKAAEEAARKAAAAGKTNNSTAKGNTGSTTTTSTGSSSLRWPCPASGRITSGYGKRKSPTAGASSNHKGIDISASTGSSIVAAAGGTVSIATYSYSAGNYVVVNHGNGLSTVYMHCSQLLVSAGDTVKAGQTIAKVGSTGYSTGSHLHFAVRKNGSYVNPSSYVSP